MMDLFLHADGEGMTPIGQIEILKEKSHEYWDDHSHSRIVVGVRRWRRLLLASTTVEAPNAAAASGPESRSVFQTYLPAIKNRLSGVVITGNHKKALSRLQP
jgi:hypothetical protein